VEVELTELKGILEPSRNGSSKRRKKEVLVQNLPKAVIDRGRGVGGKEEGTPEGQERA